MKEYSLGFVFDNEVENVLLIRKLKPIEQFGKLNGIGGKVEPGEDKFDCISREMYEEAHVDITPNRWKCFGRMSYQDIWAVHLFRADANLDCFVSKTNEIVSKFNLKEDWDFILRNSLRNVPTLITYARDMAGIDASINIDYDWHIDNGK